MTDSVVRRRHLLKGATILAGLATGGILGEIAGSQQVFAGPTRPSRPLQIASTKELGTVGHPPSVTIRDGGATAMLGGQLLWTFNDTLVVGGTNSRSNTAALADPKNPLVVHEPLDANGDPYQFIPFTAEEQAYNDSTNDPNNRIAIWPNSVIPYQGKGLIFSYKLKVQPGFLNYQFIGSVLATVEPGSTRATRLPGMLFTDPEPDFVNAMVYNGMVYVFGRPHNMDTSNGPYVAARVPLAQVTDRAAYRFWNGNTWTTDVNQVVPLFTGVPGDMSVSYNPFLGQFLAVYSQQLSPNVVMQVAPSIVGPWSTPIVAFTGQAPGGGGTDYAGKEHPELARNGGRTIYVSYFQTTGFLTGETHLVEVNLS